MPQTPRLTPSMTLHAVSHRGEAKQPAAPYSGPARAYRSDTPHLEPSADRTPYVPAPFRGTPRGGAAQPLPSDVSMSPVHEAARVHETDETTVALPWIEAFLATEDSDGTGELTDVGSSDRDNDARGESDDVADPWPLDETGVRLREMSDALRGPVVHDLRDGARDATSGHAPVPPADQWDADEWMDVLPVRRAAMPTPDMSPSVRGDSQHVAASILESVAARVRRGELTLAGFDPAMGDAATIAAILTALLGRAR